MGSKADITDMKMHQMPVADHSIFSGIEGAGKSLETERLYLEKADVRHLDAWYEAMRDGYDDGVKWLKWSEKVPSKDDVLEEFKGWESEESKGDKRRFFIFRKEDEQLIGMIGFGRRADPDEAYVFYYVRGSQRNKGYMKEMVKEFIKWIQTLWKIQCVVVKSESDNIASAKIVRGL